MGGLGRQGLWWEGEKGGKGGRTSTEAGRLGLEGRFAV